jgi:hypothetical protein
MSSASRIPVLLIGIAMAPTLFASLAAGHRLQRAPPDIPTTWRARPATPERMNQRLEDAAAQAMGHPPLPFVSLYDIGYPNDRAEYTALNGHCVFLLTLVAPQRARLPVKRVYVNVDGQQVELKLIHMVLSDLSGTNTAAVRTFGPFRCEALYLLPIRFRAERRPLLADLGDQKGAEVAVFRSPVSSSVAAFMEARVSDEGPAAQALDVFVRREYPGFFAQ